MDNGFGVRLFTDYQKGIRVKSVPAVMLILVLFLSISFPHPSLSSELRITELMADGNRTFIDEDGEYPDWIEIFNAGNETVNLAGWHLTDNPADLDLWSFPDIPINPGNYLLVFASGKDRRDPTRPLHTNFRLNADGEYLALVEPDRQTIAHEYAPFPNQKVPKEGFSYGEKMERIRLVMPGSPVRIHIPQNDSLKNQWIQDAFDDSGWMEGTLGVGFGSRPGSFSVTLVEANTQVNSLATAESVLRDPTLQSRVVVQEAERINFRDNQEDGHFTMNAVFPGHKINQDINNFVVLVTGSIIITEEDTWTFAVNSDDGTRLRIDNQDVIVDDSTHGPTDRFVTLNMTAGAHTVELLYFEATGGAELEFFAGKGQLSVYNRRFFRLVGDSGGLELEGFSSLVGTNLEVALKNKHTTAYLRIPFTVSELESDYNLYLKMKYNDGFVAYLNGKEIARKNAPTPLDWNSSATQLRTLNESLTGEEFVLGHASSLLNTGTNILAIQGLNHSLNDEEFLIQPTLHGIAVSPNEDRFFSPPTPGAFNSEGIKGFAEQVTFSHLHGFYDQPFDLSLTTPTSNALIRYTMDGTEPSSENGFDYNKPLHITTTTPLRVIVLKEDYEPSDVQTQTYLFAEAVLKQRRPDGYPSRWGGGVNGDYDMDPDIINDPRYKNTAQDDLKSLPVISIVSDPASFFDTRTGIYTHTDNKGVAWERPCSTELFYPNNQRKGFQINNGIRIQGGYSRVPDRKKHSFRLLFKRDYGPPTLRYKLFDNSPVDKFDQVVLRGGYNYTWHGGEGGFGSNIARADYLRDEFSRRCQLATGQVASHGIYVHLYLNGLYWGIYNLCERPDDSFGAEYFGGEKEEYDVVTGGTRGINTTQVKAGNKDAWNAMMDLVRKGGFENDENYRAIQQYVDFDSVIDYMMVIYFTGNRDAPTVIGGGGRPWNFYSNRRRLPGEGFRFFCWDSEWTLEEPTRNVVTFHTKGRDDPSFIFLNLMKNPDFKMRVADRIQKHFFNNGGLTPASTLNIYTTLEKTIDRAIVAESMRWGDVKGGRPKTRDDNWLPEINRIKQTYLPVRTDIVVNQLKNAGFYPTIPAPVFNQHGGVVERGFPLTMQIDKSLVQEEMITTSILPIDTIWKYDQSGTAFGPSWKSSSFNDSRWRSGKALFYVESASLPAPKNTRLTLGQTTYYFRKKFVLEDELDADDVRFEINTVIDDGAIITVNGKEVLRLRMLGGTVTHDTFANQTVTNAVFEGPFQIPKDVLKKGTNIITVEVHQTNPTSSDIVFGLTLNALRPKPLDNPSRQLPILYTLDGSDPRRPGGQVSPIALTYQGGISLTENATVKARTFVNGEWSALNEATFLLRPDSGDVATVQNNLRITELMYNPPQGSAFEFIELHNTHPDSPLPLTGLGFTDGITYSFPDGASIPPQGYAIVAAVDNPRDQAAFRQQYGLESSTLLFAPYAGKLSNAGERITISILQTDTPVLSFEYDDGRGWPLAADGAGHSLVPLVSALPRASSGSLEYGGNWRASFAIGGSPGKQDDEPLAGLVINEFAANTNGETNSQTSDWIELYNLSNVTIHLGGWYLSDDRDNLDQWALPGRDLAPGQWIVLDETSGFNQPASSGFGLSKSGEQVFLSYLPGEKGIDRVVDAVSFKAQEPNITLGRYPDGNPYFQAMPPTPGLKNTLPYNSLVIDEIMYHPQEDSTGMEDVSLYEYIELWNPTDEPIPFNNKQEGFRLAGGVDKEFSPLLTLPPHQRILLVGFNPSDPSAVERFKKKYNMGRIDTMIVGPYTGKLSNKGERIALEKPLLDEGSKPGLSSIAWNIVDEVIYFDDAPWLIEPDGSGKSLQRVSIHVSGNDPSNWVASEPTPGQQTTSLSDWMMY